HDAERYGGMVRRGDRRPSLVRGGRRREVLVPRDPARLTVSGAQAAPRRVVVVADTHRYRLLLRLARNHLDHRNPGKEAESPDTRNHTRPSMSDGAGHFPTIF